jgi:hypothetical protein
MIDKTTLDGAALWKFYNEGLDDSGFPLPPADREVELDETLHACVDAVEEGYDPHVVAEALIDAEPSEGSMDALCDEAQGWVAPWPFGQGIPWLRCSRYIFFFEDVVLVLVVVCRSPPRAFEARLLCA